MSSCPATSAELVVLLLIFNGYYFLPSIKVNHNKKNRPRSILDGFDTPKATIVERSQLEIEQFLAMLRFENRSKFKELPDIPK